MGHTTFGFKDILERTKGNFDFGDDGDVYPITSFGKLLEGVISVLGLGLVALPTGILTSGFAKEVQRKRSNFTCPHCGKHLH